MPPRPEPDQATHKELKPYRSQAERTRVIQGYALIGIALCNIALSATIILTR